MRRVRTHARRIGAGVALLMPLALMATAQAATRPAKRPQDAAATPAPPAGASVPVDPIAAAFALFPPIVRETREEVAPTMASLPAETVPMPPASVVEMTPGSVGVPRFEPASPSGPMAASYAAEEPPAAAAVERMLRDEIMPSEAVVAMPRPAPVPASRAGQTAAPALGIPMPRRRPAFTPPAAGTSEPRVKLASLGPAPDMPASAVDSGIAESIEMPILGEPKRVPKEALPYLTLLKREAAVNKVPLWLAVGVGWVESKYQPNLRGSHGVVGLMQVMPSTARFQGYQGPTDKLIEPETNIVWGMRELGWAWAQSHGNACLTVAKYKGGIATKTISGPAMRYCQTAKKVTGMASL